MSYWYSSVISFVPRARRHAGTGAPPWLMAGQRGQGTGGHRMPFDRRLGFCLSPAVLIGLPVGRGAHSVDRWACVLPTEAVSASTGASRTSSLRRQLSLGWRVKGLSLVK
jgi:hypothetical protein